jgi:hypothetical protein
MSAIGGSGHGRRMERRLRQRKSRLVSYVGLVMLVVGAAAVLVLALQK